jgi:uncharacterized membrane protein
MAVDFGRALEKSTEGYEALTWVLYIAAGVVTASPWIDISGTALFVGSIVILIIAGLRKSEAAATLFGSHMQNVFSVMLASMLIGGLLWLFTVMTLGIGIIISWPLSMLLVAWSAYRLIKGVLRLKDGVAFG